MLILVLIDVQYLRNDVFSFEKGLIRQSLLKVPSSNKIISQHAMSPILYIYLENPDPFQGLYCFYYMLRLWLVESSVVVPFCVITSMRDAVIINYRLFL